MDKALITFSNGETLELHEDQKIIPIIEYTNKDNEISVSKDCVYEIWYHGNEGLIPSIAELLCRCSYFQLMENENKIYCSSAVVSLENL